MRGEPPLIIELEHILGVLGLDQFRNELKLFPELDDPLLKNCYLFGRPPLKHTFRVDWIDQDVEVFFLVELVDSVKVHLDGFLFLLLGGFEDLRGGGQDWQDGVLL